ncbi:protein FAF-like, chloroplastic [Magnolia sinica]|uniref:protein FAF-like, chloroplastic n=1 Tax=Magnolia sinica TaxID=86752 RepID=UPI00265AA2FE|nr:protein FAF-like, chloroplastic [Magnolia sinica]
MSSAVRRCPRLPVSLRLEEELIVGDQQGIGTILGFSSSAERQRTETRKSLRRTFSADMSSKKWLAQHMPISLKKTASSQEFSAMPIPDSSSASSSASEEEEEREERRKELERPSQCDIWNLIQSQKTADPNSPLPPPYIHPLVKRSSSSLSQKSLQICTESLGSETGSDSISPPEIPDYLVSESSNEETEEERVPVVVEEELKDTNKEPVAANYRCLMSRKSPPRSFPPPLPSISNSYGPRLRMKPHRKDGRLVLAAISIPSHNTFHAERQDGRLVLSFINKPVKEDNHTITKDKGLQIVEEEKIVEEEEEEVDEVAIKKGIVFEVKIVQEEVAAAVMKVHRSTLVMDKIVSGMHLNNPNPWVKRVVEERDVLKRASPITPTAPVMAFNGYNRAAIIDRPVEPRPSNLIVSKKPMVVVKPEEFLPMVMRCMEFCRPVLVWEPRCIATT